MFCAISGKPARIPVLSPTSKCVFEKNLLEQYVKENGKDPISNQPMKLEDIIVISQTAQQASLTSTVGSATLNTNYSIPSLLSTLQNEWDALMLENFKLRKQLDQMSKEFSTALFQRDAAKLVAARLLEEKAVKLDDIDKVVSVLANESQTKENNTSMNSAVSTVEEVFGETKALPKRIVEDMRKRAKICATATNPTHFSPTVLPSDENPLQFYFKELEIDGSFSYTHYTNYPDGVETFALFEKSTMHMHIYPLNFNRENDYVFGSWSQPKLLSLLPGLDKMIIGVDGSLEVVTTNGGEVNKTIPVNSDDVILAYFHEFVMAPYVLVVTRDGGIAYHMLLDNQEPPLIIASGKPTTKFNGATLHKDGLLLALWNDHDVVIVNLAAMQSSPTTLKINDGIPTKENLERVEFSGDGKTMLIQARNGIFTCDLRQENITASAYKTAEFSKLAKITWSLDGTGNQLVVIENYKNSRTINVLTLDKKSHEWSTQYTQICPDEKDYGEPLTLYVAASYDVKKNLKLVQLNECGVLKWTL